MVRSLEWTFTHMSLRSQCSYWTAVHGRFRPQAVFGPAFTPGQRGIARLSVCRPAAALAAAGIRRNIARRIDDPT